jgi:3-oxoacyl-[acyl-carrier protein] reductase
MSEGEFAGRTALVTGGSRGIGRAICLALARGGARVAVNYAASADAAEAVRREIEQNGGAAITVAADVSDPQETRTAVEATEAAFGPVVNVDGVFNPVMAVKDGMIERGDGRIVCLSSIAALRPRPGVIAYATSKAAVIAFVRSCSEAFAPRVRINAVAPGLVETEMSQTLDPVARQAMIEATPLKRIGQPDEIAELVLFLLSDRASYTTGQTYVASGGRATLP